MPAPSLSPRWAIAALLVTSTTKSHAFHTPRIPQSKPLSILQSSSDADVEKLKQTALQLRAEALAARQKLDAERVTSVEPVREVVQYDAVADSCWEIM
jgi:hypothetical protein